MDATSSRFGRLLWSTFMVALAAASFYGLLWVTWDL